MTVRQLITTLRLDNSVTHADDTQLTWVATAATLETAAGSSVGVTIVRTKGAGVTPDDPDSLTLRYVNDAAGVVKTVTLNTTSASQTDTFHFTDTGNSGGTARCGTIEIKLQATRAGVGSYDVETDGAPNTPPAGFDAHTDRGWVRGTTTLIEAVSNASAGGAKTEPAEYDESLFVRTTAGAVSYVARALTVASSAGSLSGSTNSTTAVTRDVTFTTVVDERFAAASTVVSWTVTVPNAALTGSPDWTYSSTTDDTITVDPRITCQHHFQIDDNAFGLSKNVSSNQMLSTESGFLWTILKGARGTGKNGLTIQQTLTPVNPGAAVSDVATATTTQDSQAGVSGRLDWTASKPGGTWDKTIDISAPSDIDGDTYEVNGTAVLTMLAPDPTLKLLLTTAQATPTHWVPGQPLRVAVGVFDSEALECIESDSGSQVLYLIRSTGTEYEYLRPSDMTWQTMVGTPITGFVPTASAAEPCMHTYTFSPTTGWEGRDLTLIGRAKVGGTPYAERLLIATVSGTQNPHDSGGGGSVAPYGGTSRRALEEVRKKLREIERSSEEIRTEIVERETQIVERITTVESRREIVNLMRRQDALQREMELLAALVLASV